jgi:hypothetical protein
VINQAACAEATHHLLASGVSESNGIWIAVFLQVLILTFVDPAADGVSITVVADIAHTPPMLMHRMLTNCRTHLVHAMVTLGTTELFRLY